MAQIKIQDLRPGDYAGMPPSTWWEKWICHAEGCKTFHWIWMVRPVNENGKRIDFITSESIEKGTALTRLDGRKVMIWRLKGDPIINPDDIIDIHAEFGNLPYSMGMNIWSGIWYLAKHYFGKVIPFIKFEGVNCLYWVDLGSLHMGIDLVPGDPDYIMQLDLEQSSLLQYVGELN